MGLTLREFLHGRGLIKHVRRAFAKTPEKARLNEGGTSDAKAPAENVIGPGPWGGGAVPRTGEAQVGGLSGVGFAGSLGISIVFEGNFK